MQIYLTFRGKFIERMLNFFMYFSGISGGLLLAICMATVAMDSGNSKIYLISGLVLLGIVFFPLFLIYRSRQKKKIRQIIDSYKEKDQEKKQVGKNESDSKGWSMNDSPFRERKSGLNWGGGNVHAANANRGKRRSFMKK